jgi:hypothetical protein
VTRQATWFVRGLKRVTSVCVCVDTQHRGERRVGNVRYIGADVLDLSVLKEPRIVFAFPPCTHLAVSGARWFKAKGLSALIEALTIVNACRELCESSGVPYLIENPVSTLSTYWREPDFRFDPYQYGDYLKPPGDAYTKKTCLWTGGGFVMPTPKPVDPVEGSKMHKLPPSADRADLRSATPLGFAYAVFQANH